MRLSTTLPSFLCVLALGVSPIQAALRANHAAAPQSSETDRELFFFADDKDAATSPSLCARQLSICRAGPGGAELPLQKWMRFLSSKTETTSEQQTKTLSDMQTMVEQLPLNDFQSVQDLSAQERASLQSSLVEPIQSASASSTVPTDDSAIFFDGIDLQGLVGLAQFVIQLIVLIQDGTGWITVVLFILQFLGGFLGEMMLLRAAALIFPNADQACLAELTQCRYQEMVRSVVPLLLGGVLFIL